MNKPVQFSAKLADKKILNDKFEQYFFEVVQPHHLPFTAGQYVSIKVSDLGERRSYSLASSSAIDHGFELLVDVSPQGLGTKYLQSLKFGQEIAALGPLGVFTISDSPAEKQLALVATGSGIAPFRSMILELLQQKNDPREITLYWGMRHAAQLFWMDELQELADAFPQFHFHPTLSQAPTEWPLCRGRVTDCVSHHPIKPDTGYYLCGNSAMMADMMSFLKANDVPDSLLHIEKFT
ncbi:MAG: FAD-binding oxidoreductase [bacterium]|nr:FAD-binding oxidoreductase [bacterium]